MKWQNKRPIMSFSLQQTIRIGLNRHSIPEQTKHPFSFLLKKSWDSMFLLRFSYWNNSYWFKQRKNSTNKKTSEDFNRVSCKFLRWAPSLGSPSLLEITYPAKYWYTAHDLPDYVNTHSLFLHPSEITKTYLCA